MTRKTQPQPRPEPKPLQPITLDQAATEIIALIDLKIEHHVETIAKFQNEAQHDLLYALQWCAESAVRAQVSHNILINIRRFAETIAGSPNFLDALEERLTSQRQAIIDELLRIPYEHCSTSLLSNAIEEWTHVEKAKAVADFGIFRDLLGLTTHYRARLELSQQPA